MPRTEARSGVCLAELIAALSLGTDLGLGHPMEHVLRQCVIALGLGERFGLEDSERSVVYYTALLAWVGCHADSYEQARWFGDDIAVRADNYTSDLIGMNRARFVMRNLGAGRPPADRARTALQCRELSLALRFSTGTCLVLVAMALALESPAMIFALSGVGLAAGFSPRHPFDLLWNHVARHLTGGPALPPNPTRRRHAFKIGTVWLALVGALLSAEATTAAFLLGGLLLAACTAVTATNLCLPSEMLAWLARRSSRTRAVAG